jgi:hypothetical protein
MFFDFDSAQNVTNKRAVSSVDIKVFANNKIRIGDNAAEVLKLSGRNVLIVKDKNGNVAITSTDPENGQGREVNKKFEFSNQFLAESVLGGVHSEWKLVGEPMINPVTEDAYYLLEQTVNGADVILEAEEIIVSEVENTEFPVEEEMPVLAISIESSEELLG